MIVPEKLAAREGANLRERMYSPTGDGAGLRNFMTTSHSKKRETQSDHDASGQTLSSRRERFECLRHDFSYANLQV